MRAFFLVAAFAVAASGLKCPRGTCHDDDAHAGCDADHATQTAHQGCQCLACGTLAATTFPGTAPRAAAPEPVGWVHLASARIPRAVDPDTPFHPPRA